MWGRRLYYCLRLGQSEPIAQQIVEGMTRMPLLFIMIRTRAGIYALHQPQRRTGKIGFLSIGIGIVHNSLKELTSFAQVSSIGSELKCLAKQHEGSYYAVDRRS